MSRAELKARYLFDSLHMEETDSEVRRHLMVLLLTMPSKPAANEGLASEKKKALQRLAGCVTLPDNFDYKASLQEALNAKYM